MYSKTNTFRVKILFKKLILKIGNGMLVGIGIIFSIGIFGLVYAWTGIDSNDAASGRPLTSTLMQGIINNINELNNKLGTQTEGKMCTSVSGKVTCSTNIPTSGITTEIDPKVGTQTEGKMCTSVSGKVTCSTNIPTSGITTEIDPKVGTLTSGKMCTSDGVMVNCNTDLPALSTCIKGSPLYIRTTTTITNIWNCAKSYATSVTTSCTPSAYSSWCNYRPTSCTLLGYLCQ